jgi:hypothetical protein
VRDAPGSPPFSRGPCVGGENCFFLRFP